MDLLSLLADSAWLAVVGGIFGSIFGSVLTFLTTKSSHKKEIEINERIQLSKDQYQLIAELKDLIQEQGDEVEALKREMRELQQLNLSLMVENKELQFKIQGLTNKLNEFQKNGKGE